MSVAAAWARSGLRAAMTTSAPASASARAVSMPMPVAAPVTMARVPRKSWPAATSLAVLKAPKGEVMRVLMAWV